MLDGASYALFSPLWGVLLDWKVLFAFFYLWYFIVFSIQVSPVLAFLFGDLFMLSGYCLMGPAPFLEDLLPDSPWTVAAGMAVHG